MSDIVDPRIFTRPEAAAYCGLKPAGFSSWVREGILPGPIPGRKRWDRRAIDAALDKLSGLDQAQEGGSALDAWKAKRRN